MILCGDVLDVMLRVLIADLDELDERLRDREAMSDPAVLARHADRFPPVPTFTLAEVFGEWPDVQRKHFGDGGVFDQLFKPGR